MTRTYVVTGSASGIGNATMNLLTSQGARVIGVDIRDADVTADLSTPTGRAAMIDEVTKASGGTLNGVIACAGLLGTEPVVVAVNYFGAVATLEGLRPLLAKGDQPRAVTISSVASLHAADDATVDACLDGDEEAALLAAKATDVSALTVYSSSKVALARWVRRTAPSAAWAEAGISLNAIAPGVIETPMMADMLSTDAGRELVDGSVQMPFGGHGTAERVAPLLVWLASAENSMVTGQVIFIDGGCEAITRGDKVW